MPPLLGPLHVVVLLLGVLLSLLVGLLVGALTTLFGLTASRGLAALLGALCALLLLALFEFLLRRREARGQLEGAGNLDDVTESALERVESLGGEARRLARAARLGVPIPDAIVVTSEIAEQWLRTQGTRKNVALRELLPHAASASIEAFLHRSQGAKLSLRPSFDVDEPKVPYPGLFPTTSDLEPVADERLLGALQSAAAAAHGTQAAAYRRRVGTVASVRRAFVLMRQLDPDISGSAESRGIGGVADTVLIDFARRNAPATSVGYDLAQQNVRALAPDTPLERVPSWMHRLAGLLVGLEGELGSPIAVDYAVQNGQLFLTSLRRAKITPRTVWISDGGPLSALGGRVPRFVRESLGGVQAAAQGLSAALGSLGRVVPEQLRDEDGVTYLDFEVLRKALGRLTLRVLLREPLWPLFALSRPVSAGTLPALPEITLDVLHSVRRYNSYCERHLQSLRRAHYELVLRSWLINAVIAMLADGAHGEPVPSMHRTLHKLLGHRAQALASEAASARSELVRQDEELQNFVTTLVARGATDWSSVFVGDRHHYASLAELDNWAGNARLREGLGVRWEQEKQAFSARAQEPTPGRLFDPGAPSGPKPSSASVIALVPGSVSGTAHAPDARAEPVAGKILFLADGRAEYAAHVLSASGLVLTGGGLTSPMAALARELAIPTLICVQRKPLKSYPIGGKVLLDANAPALRY
ncbi:MAG TPA: PEP-utilizing enzyme [Polyangiaceae bacterium]|nr:PEP-utilizing enzyme [Polyangiaceae bacterium]